MSDLRAVYRAIAGSGILTRLGYGVSWSLIGTLASQAFLLFSTIAVARTLSRIEFGGFVLTQTTLLAIGVFAGGGLGTAAMRSAAQLRSLDPQRLGRIFAVVNGAVVLTALLSAVFVAGFSGFLAKSVFGSPTLKGLLLLASPAVIFSALDGYQKSILIGLERMREFALSGVIGAAVASTILVVASLYFGVEGAAAGLALASLAQYLTTMFFMRRVLREAGLKYHWRGCLRERSVLGEVAVPALLGSVMVSPVHWICISLIARTPGGPFEIALIGVCMHWFNATVLLPSLVTRVASPMLIGFLSSRDNARAFRLLALSYGASVAATALVAIPVMMFSGQIVGLYGAQYRGDGVSIIVAACAAAVLCVQMPVTNIILALGRLWVGFFMNAGWALAFIAGVFLMRMKGAQGFFAAMCAAYLLHLFWTSAFSWATIRKLHRTVST